MADEGRIVVVRHNMVCEIRRSPQYAGPAVSQTPLEAGTRLATNFRDHGCIDGDYAFADAAQARVFALLCLDFVRALAEKRHGLIERLAASQEFRADEPGERDGKIPGLG